MKEISNRSATYHFSIEQKFTAGLVLLGTEIKSIRSGKASFNDSFCVLHQGEIWIRNLHIAEYHFGTSNNHNPTRERKLLLTKKEIKKIETKIKERGNTLIPLKIFIAENGYAKIEIALAKGKKLHDKRDSIKEKDVQRELKRSLKI
ncbi:MAG TPA: SsrA-binding protein SmpB [Chitinophagaceae bacterium]|nr:MAG: single-stranded DNA-binding protein [Bacteroidetes bacterium OLB11]HMN33487.1 SsrA-binding protein SmpB [Chitinophagaceae bacterium]